MRLHTLSMTGLAAIAALVMAACGSDGGSSTPTSPSPSPSGGGTGGSTATAATITIGPNGSVSPKTVTIALGGRVTFVNNDSRSHDMESDPHPSHTDCPPISSAGFLSAGQSKATASFTTIRTCGYHDHSLPDDTNLQGTIVIVAASAAN